MQAKLLRARKICEAGIDGLYKTPDTVLEEARALPANSAEEKAIRSDAITEAKQLLSCKKLLIKKFPNGITPITDEDRAAVEAIRKQLLQRLLKEKAFKDLDKAEDLYKKATKALHDAQRIVREYHNQSNFDELMEKYEEAKAALELEKQQNREIEEQAAQQKETAKKGRRR